MKIRSLTVLLLLVPALASAQSQDDAQIRDAATRGLAAIQKAQSNWFTSYKQVCASCHHQYQPALAYRAARERGIPVDETIAEQFGRLKASLQSAGQIVADFDLLIAATALVHTLQVVTHNTRHFNRIPGLALDDWLA